MSDVYVVTQGQYSDYGIMAVFRAKQEAEAFVAAHGGDKIEEYDFAVWEPEMGKWSFEFNLSDGMVGRETLEASLKEPTSQIVANTWRWKDPLVITVAHGDRERALKIASEYYTQIRAVWDAAEAKARTIPERDPHKGIFQGGLTVTDPQGLALDIAKILSGKQRLEDLPECGRTKIIRKALGV